MQTAASHLLNRLREPGSARQLALLRIAMALYLGSVLWSPAYGLLLEFGPRRSGLSYVPTFVDAWVAENLDALLAMGLVACVLLGLGLLTRLAVVAAFVAHVSIENFYYTRTFFHDTWPYTVFMLLVMCFAPIADAWSLDAWILRRRRPSAARDPLRYRWPIEVMILWIGIVYTAAGIAKLVPLNKGWVWLQGGTIQNMVAERFLDSGFFWLLGRTPFDYTKMWVFVVLSVLTVLTELSAVLLLFSRRSYLWVYLALLGMHVAIYLFGVPGFVQSAYLWGLLLLPARWFRDVPAREESAGGGTSGETVAARPDGKSGVLLAADSSG